MILIFFQAVDEVRYWCDHLAEEVLISTRNLRSLTPGRETNTDNSLFLQCDSPTTT